MEDFTTVLTGVGGIITPILGVAGLLVGAKLGSKAIKAVKSLLNF